jgi:hypothetical protein
MSLSLSAQIGTLPILTRMSGYTSIIAIFTNLIFVPVTAFLYTLTLICFIISSIASTLFSGAGSIMGISDLLITSVDLLISKIDFSLFTIPTSLGGFSVIWYIAIGCLSDYFNLSACQKTIILIASLVAVFGGNWLI